MTVCKVRIAKDVLISIVAEAKQVAVAMIDAAKNALNQVIVSVDKSLQMQHETELKTLEILGDAIRRDDITIEESCQEKMSLWYIKVKETP